MLACGSAVGEKLPPYVVHKAKTADPAWMEKEQDIPAVTLDGWKKHDSQNGFALSFCQLQNQCESLCL